MQKVKVMNKKKEKEIEYTEKDPLFWEKGEPQLLTKTLYKESLNNLLLTLICNLFYCICLSHNY